MNPDGIVAAPIGGYLRVRASVFLTKGDRTSGVEGTHQILPDTGEPAPYGWCQNKEG